MAHLDRLRELTYTSPSGKVFKPLWDDLERSGGKKAAIHEMPQQNVADVQDLGNVAERFPMSLYFAGADYDQSADSFYSALGERGTGTLAHPRWGDRSVLPLTWAQTEAFVDGMRAARFSVEFIDAPEPSSLTAVETTAAAVASAAEETAEVAEDSAAAQMTTETAPALAKLKEKVVKRVQETVKRLTEMAGMVDEVRSEIDTLGGQIERTIDTLVTTPTTLAQNIIALARAPARSITDITAKVSGFAALIGSAIDEMSETDVGAAAAGALDIIANLLGLLESVSEGSLASRSAAVDASDTISATVDAGLAALEALERSAPGFVFSPELQAMIAKLKAQALGYLQESSYTLPTERIYTTVGERDPLTLAFELYGTIEALDRLIADNALAGDEILVIPGGREIRYYA